MYRFLLTPRWWGINVFVLLAVPVCLFMGSWQLSRFEARVDTHNEQQSQADSGKTAAAEPLGKLLPVTQQTSGRQVTATGRFDTAHQLLVPDRVLGHRHGFYVLTLLRTEGSDQPGAGGGAPDGGKALPVVRGWLPGDVDNSSDTAEVPPPPSGEVTVSGVLQASEHQGDDGVQAGGGLPEGQLGMISAASLVNLVSYDVYDAWVTSSTAPGALEPVPPVAAAGTGLDLKAFQNLGYTGEWFVFAGFVLFMWFRLFRREREVARDLALGITPTPAPTPRPGPDPASASAPDLASDETPRSASAPDPASDEAPNSEPDPDPEPSLASASDLSRESDGVERTRSPSASV